MSQQPEPLHYAGPMTRNERPAGYGLLIGALAVMIGFLTANAFADGIGLPQVPRGNYPDPTGYIMLRIGCGIVMACFAAVVMTSLIRTGHGIADLLARSRQRPGEGVAITLIVVGACCVLGAVAIPLYFARVWITNFNGMPMGITVQMPLLADFLAILTFVGGAAGVGIGIWASMAPRAPMPDVRPAMPGPPTLPQAV